MPFYEYQCTECGHRLEKLQKMSDAVLVECPSCHAATLKKLVSAAAFRLKGTGWYETDFKNGQKKDDNSGKSDSAVKSGTEPASGSGSDSDTATDGGKKTTKESAGSTKSSESKDTPSTSKQNSATVASKSSNSGGASQHPGS